VPTPGQQIAAEHAGRARTGSHDRLYIRAHRLTTTSRFLPIPRHTAQKQQFDVLIHYPHHPRVGERVVVVRTVHHAGVLHFVIDLADGTRGLLPEWMADQNAAKFPLVEAVTLSLAALRDLRATLDGHLLSSASFSNTQEIGSHVGPTPGLPTRPSASGSNVRRPRKASTRSPRNGCRSAQTTPERVRPGNGEDETG
jgi:hypothetical protein